MTVICASAEQRANAPSPICIKALPESAPETALPAGILFRAFTISLPIVTFVSAEQLLKAWLPMVVTLAGIDTSVSSEHPSYAPSPMAVTV